MRHDGRRCRRSTAQGKHRPQRVLTGPVHGSEIAVSLTLDWHPARTLRRIAVKSSHARRNTFVPRWERRDVLG